MGIGFMMSKSEYESLDEILFRYKKSLNLTTPCPGSPFLTVFDPPPTFSRYTSFLMDDL